MALELNKEFIESNGLSEDQVKAITEFGDSYADNLVADTKKEYDGKAHNDAQAILDGASSKITESTGIKRNQGEKAADFMTRAWGEFSSSSQSELDKAKSDYEDKVKNFKGDDATREALEKATLDLDNAQKKYADYDSLKDNADKLTPLQEKYNKLKLDSSFGQERPNFPDTVNTFEADAKWNEFKTNLLKDNTIEIVDGISMVISNENQYKQEKLKDLIEKDPVLSELMKGRQQKGLNGKQTEMHKIDGVPFDVPKDASVSDKSRLIQEYLAKEGMNNMSTQYSEKFRELNSKINA